MIHIHAAAVISVLDGFLNKPLNANSISCTVDGAKSSIVRKPQGIIVLLDLADGRHAVTLAAHGFQTECFEIDIDNGTCELTVGMQPDRGYPFPCAVSSITGTVRSGNGSPVSARLIVTDQRCELKIAQDTVKPGDTQVKLFIKNRPGGWPCACLITDGKKSELCSILSPEGELASPLINQHKRGVSIYPVREFHTDANGRYYAAFSKPGDMCFFIAHNNELKEVAAELLPGRTGEKDFTI